MNDGGSALKVRMRGGALTPLPETPLFLLEALLQLEVHENLAVSLKLPVEVGSKRTTTDCELPLERLYEQPLVQENGEERPETLPVTVPLPPVFCTVNVRFELLPTVTSPKFREEGVTVISGPEIPLPKTALLLLPTLLPKIASSLRLPDDVGLNLMVVIREAPAESEYEQLFVHENGAASPETLPVTVPLPPVFFTVKVRFFVVPTSTSPKFREEGVTVILGPETPLPETPLARLLVLLQLEVHEKLAVSLRLPDTVGLKRMVVSREAPAPSE